MESLPLSHGVISEEKAMTPYSSTLAWRIPWTEEPGGLPPRGSLGVGHDGATSLSCSGEGNGNPLQCSCLENPRDEGAWWAAVYGVAKSRTRLKQLTAAAAKSLQSCLTLCDPTDGSPPGSAILGILQARTLE